MRKFLSIFSLLLLCIWQGKAQDAASVTWALTDETPLYSGQLENAEMNLKGLAINGYGSPDATLTLMLEGGGSTTWHTAEKEDCYIEFSVTSKTGNKFQAKEISAYVCGKGGTNVRANFYYSTDPTFATKTQINYKVGADLSRDNAAGYDQMTVAINEALEAGDRVYFRIYPYYTSGSTGKYLCLKDVVISGETEATEVEASVVWPFISDLKPVISGALLAQDMAYSSNAKQYAWDARVTIDNTAVANGTFCTNTSDCLWTASPNTIQDDVYVQYAVAPKTGATLTVKEVSLMISATSTTSLAAAVYASKDETFATKTLLKDVTALVNNELQLWTITLGTPEVVETGETYYLRIYPFNNTSTNATHKLVGVRNVTVSGTMIGATSDPAEVSTVSAATYISTTTALAGGSVTNDGGAPVTARGIVWSTLTEPTTDDSKTEDGDGAGAFESTLTELTAGTTYYARAYATNKAGTSYGNEISFTTLPALMIPTVETTGSSSIRNVSVIISGKVTAWGGTDVTERGIVWGTEANPTGNKIEAGSDLGTFQGYIDGLTPQTKYYARAYAVNSTGIAYGADVEVTTKATDPDVTKVIDPAGNGDYTTVQDAFDAVPSDYTGKWIIRIKPGTYNERPTLLKGKVNVYLVGEDAATTIITHNTAAGTINPSTGQGWGTSNSQTMAIMADDFMAVNITFENTYKNLKTITTSAQAVALKTQGDRQSFYNCRITGYQDTYLGNSIGRAYFKDCYIEGNVDFIFGRQTVVFDNCTTYVNRDGSVLTAPSTEKTTKFGFVFLDCELTAPSTSYVDFNGTTFKGFHYGRPWQQQPRSAFLRCEVPATLAAVGWTTMSSGLSPVFVEYGCTGDGATSSRLSQRGNEGRVMTEEEASAYTIVNVFKKDTDPSFAADWMPVAPDNTVLSINSSKADEVKQSYCLPTVFSDKFTVYYTLANDSKVSIALYNINGMLVKTLVKDSQAQGSYSVEFNEGSSLSSGVYFYTIQTEAGIESQKIIKK